MPTNIVFLTLGSAWTESDGQAIISSTGVAPSTSGSGNADVIALLDTNTNSANTTQGLKVGTAFTISSTFALTALPPGSYGMQLTDGTSTHGADQVVSLLVQGQSNGSTVVELLQQNLTTNPVTTTLLASETLTSTQLADNTQIEFQLAHVANSTAITGTFELIDNGSVTSTTTFAPTGTIFTGGLDWTRADILAVATPGVGLSVGAGQSPQIGQTLTASATTNDPDATGINYQWEESTSSSFTTFSDIGTNGANYTVNASDVGDYIRVVATTSDDSATAMSVVTGAVDAVVSATTSSIAANPGTVTANGVATTTLTVTAEDSSGDLVPGATVTLSATGSGNTFTPISGTTNADGVFTATLDSTVVENETIQALINGMVTETASVAFVPALITWASAVSGNWQTALDWSGGDVPDSADAATINASGSYVVTISSADVAYSLAIDNAGTTVAINSGGTLSLGGVLTLAEGTVELNSGGIVSGGTLVSTGGNFVWTGGTLSGVTYDGTLNLSPNNSTVYIATSLTANNSAGTGPGTINLTGVSDTISFEGTQTFNNATINLGNTSGYYDYIYNYDTNNTGSVLTLGPNVIVNQAVNETSGYAELYSSGSHTGDGIVNDGTINALAANGTFYIEPYNFTNQGTINVANGDKLYIEPTVGLTNAATGDISISSAGSTFDFGGGTGATSNAGSITMVAGTTLTLGSSTSALSNTGSISGTGDTVNIYSFGGFSNTGTFNITNSTVNLYGSYTTPQLAVFANDDDTITIDGTLTNTGQTLTVGSGSALGTVVLASGGMIVGGTIVDQGSGVEFQSGTLSGVTYDGTLNLSPNNSTVYIATSLTANNSAGTGPGTINLTGVSDTISFEGTQTFNNATINLGNTSGYYDYIYNYDTNNTGSVLTLGPNVIVNQAVNETSGYAELYSSGSHTGDGIVNDGTINALAANGTFYIEPYNFTNQGTINVANGDKLYIEPTVGLTNAATGDISISSAGSTFDFGGGTGATSNAGSITMVAGTTLTLGSSTSALSNTGSISGTGDTVNIYSFGGFSNTGTFNITNSTVNLYGSYTTPQLAVFANDDDTITIDGTLTNTGQTLTVGSGSALGTVVLASGGMIVGGTIVDQGSGVEFQSGTLSGVTYDGTLNLSPNNSTVYIATSLTANNSAGTGPGTINLTGVSDTISFEGTQTFNNATINLGNTSGYYDYIYNYDTNNTGSVLTLGPNVIVNQAVNETSGYAELYSSGSHTGDGIVNDGTINALAANGTFYIEPYNFTNQGTINVANGDKLYIEPTVGLTNAATGDISISSAGSTFDFGGGTGATSNAGSITMVAGTTLTLGSSTSALSNTGSISGTGDTVNIYSFGGFSNTGTFNITNSTVNLYGSYTTPQLAVFANDDDTITIDGTLTNTGQTLTVGSGSALGTVVLASGGMIVGGTIVDQGSGVEFQSGTLSGVTYDGTLNLSPNNSTVYIATSLTANNSAGTGPGTINLTGVSDTISFEGTQTFNNATINLGNTSGYYDYIYNYDTNNTGSVLTLGPNVIVNQAVNETSGYAELYSSGSHTGDGIVNDGTINALAANGTFYIEPYNFTNQGTINVANGDKLYIEPTTFTNNGTIAISGGTVDITTSISGTGNATINGGTLELGGSSAETVTFTGSSGTPSALELAVPSAFDGTIFGITGPSQMLDLIGYNISTIVTPSSNATGDTILTVTDTGQTTLMITLGANYSGAWTVTGDGHGGVDIYDPPAAVATIANGSALDLNEPSSETVAFTGGTGSLVLNDPEGFTGQIAGFTGTAPDAAHSDTIDLIGINYDSSGFAESYNSSTGLLTVTDGTNTASITFDDFNATLDFASDANGGTLITDPPAAGSSGTTAGGPADPDMNLLGMKFEDDQIHLDAGQVKEQSAGAVATGGADGMKDPLVSLHNDNFVFHQDLGAATEANTHPVTDNHELATHPDAQLAQQLAALVTPDPHHEAYSDLVHNDGLTSPSGVTLAQWHEHLTNIFQLH